MNDHFIVALDRGHLRIYAEIKAPAQKTPRLTIVEAMDFPAGKGSYTAHETDAAGRFPGSKGGTAGIGSPGMSIDERLPIKREESRRAARLIAAEIDKFLRSRLGASWDLAATPSLYNAVIEELSPETRRRLKRALSKDLVNQNAEEVRIHFATAGR